MSRVLCCLAALLFGLAGARGASVNVRAPEYGARGDGRTDDTAAIQRAIQAVAGTGGTVLVPAGTYLVNTVASSSRGLVLGSRMTLKLADGAVLKAIPSAAQNYTIVSVASATQVAILGGTLLGDRSRHTGGAGEWGMGLSIQNSQQVSVSGVVAMDCWGDGFYISGSADVTLAAVRAEHNRRNGLSVTSCAGLSVRGSVFRNSRGTAPEAGLDIEPNPGETVDRVAISGCTFADNAGSGLESGVPDSNLGRAFVTNVVIDGNTFTGNGRTPADGGARMAIRISNAPGTQVLRNIVRDNTGQGIYLRYNADGSLVAGNVVTGTQGDGIVQAACRDNRIIDNRVTGNSGHGILSTNCTGGSVSGNAVSGNGRSP